MESTAKNKPDARRELTVLHASGARKNATGVADPVKCGFESAVGIATG
jgi:hypothetical protein